MARGRSELRRLLKNEIEEARHMVDENIWNWRWQEWDNEMLKGVWAKLLIPRVCDWENRPHGVISCYLT